jgi:hypothetical protein
MSAQRLRFVACYLAPSWLKGRLAREPGSLAEQHAQQALGVAFLLHGVVLASGVALLGLSAAMAWWREGFTRLEPLVNWGICGLFGAWLVVFVVGLVLGIVGSRRAIPVVRAMGGRRWVRRLAAVTSVAAHTCGALILVIALHSTRRAREFDGRPAHVYLLYDDMGFVPRWVLTLGAYRLTGAADRRWGGGSTVVACISPARLKEAFARGRVVFLATHGTYRGGAVGYGEHTFSPADVGGEFVPGPELRFVYIAACDGGAGDAGVAWDTALAPAQVVSFDRLSTNVEHAWWLWLEAPGVIAALP